MRVKDFSCWIVFDGDEWFVYMHKINHVYFGNALERYTPHDIFIYVKVTR